MKNGLGVRVLLFVCVLGGFFVQPAMAQQDPGTGAGSIVQIGGGDAQEADGAGEAATGPCGNRQISIARMQWPSSIILAEIHALLLSQYLGCDVTMVSGDMAATASSMATTGQPALAPELWVDRIAPIWNSVLETGHVRAEAPTFVFSSQTSLEGWYLPPHMKEAFPRLTRASDLGEVLGILAARGERIRFISCPPSWACSLINRNLLRAYGLDQKLDYVEPANRFEMDSLIGEAVSRKQPALFYYWEPNGVLAQFDFLVLDMGEFNEENFKCLAQKLCIDPQPSAFAPEKPFIVIADWVARVAPDVSLYLRRAVLPVEEMNLILSWQAEGVEGFDNLARRFVAERTEVWRPWVEGLGVASETD